MTAQAKHTDGAAALPGSAAGLSEAEIQILASLEMARDDDLATDKAALERSGERYWIFREDWTGALASLLAKALIDGSEAGYRLTDLGRPLGRMYYRERPDQFWYYYQRFWAAAPESAAHSRLCERAFGKDLCQDGMVDMAALSDVLSLLNVNSNDHLLDLGCGAGAIAEYISDETGATVTGLDNSAPAIALAKQRTAGKHSRLSFETGDLNALDLGENVFDATIALDALYWADDLVETLSQVVRATKPGGQLGLFMMQGPWGDGDRRTLEADRTLLAKALGDLNLTYEAHDHTEQAAEFWRRNRQAAVDLREAFEAEGNGFIAAGLIKEADEEILPAIEAGRMSRYLYHVRL